MSDYSKINYYDLRWETRHKRMPILIGRQEEIQRLSRLINRNVQHHAIITSPSGGGKTAFILGWANYYSSEHADSRPIVKLEVSELMGMYGKSPSAQFFFQAAFKKLSQSIVIIDDFAQIYNNQNSSFQLLLNLLKALTESKNSCLILCLEPEELQWLEQNQKQFLRSFETISLAKQNTQELIEIIKYNLIKIGIKAEVPNEIITETFKLIERFPVLGNVPAAAIKLLDETSRDFGSLRNTHPLLKYFSGHNSNEQKSQIKILRQIVSEKINIPIGKLNEDDREKLKNLFPSMQARIIGQEQSLQKITSVIQRAKLGLRASERPLGSFLLLGPSGVGKTETAKFLAEEFYGNPDSFLRIDMSEFAQEHTVARLIGSPAGYIGFEAGGQLTNHLKKQPYSLILLDEIEKSHSKVFDIFLQLLDDGRITSGQGETANATQSIIMATSNLAVEAILSANINGENIHTDSFINSKIIPILMQNFRAEFLNRFDAIIIFNPLSLENLVDIAFLEIKKIEERAKEHNIKFNISRETLEKKISQIADPRFGARPVKRFIEDACETLLTEKILQQP